jgi:hypothetical protein
VGRRRGVFLGAEKTKRLWQEKDIPAALGMKGHLDALGQRRSRQVARQDLGTSKGRSHAFNG